MGRRPADAVPDAQPRRLEFGASHESANEVAKADTVTFTSSVALADAFFSNGWDHEFASHRRSFIFIDDCVEGVLRLLFSECKEPINLGSEEMVSMNEFADIVPR